MTNRLNDTDLRLLRGSVNDWPQDKTINPSDNENGGQLPNSFTNEHTMNNQNYDKKVKFNTRPKAKDRDVESNRQTLVNHNRNVSIDSNSASHNRNKLRSAAENINYQSARASTEMVDLKHENTDDGEEPYVYKGYKNKTGIYKNSLILKDLTGYVEQPIAERNDVNDTIDAGTQTLIIEELTK